MTDKDHTLSPQDQELFKKMAVLMADHFSKESLDPLAEIYSLQNVSTHMLAQQLAFITAQLKVFRARDEFLQISLRKLSALIRHYEQTLKRTPSFKETTHAPEALHPGS